MRITTWVRRVMEGATILTLCGMLASSIQGCTAIGFGVGAAADARAGKGGPELLTTANVGRPMTILLRDGRTLEGRFSGWSRDPGAASSAADSLPLGEQSVKLATRGGEVTVRVEDIASVRVSVSRGKVTGLLVGATADLIAIALAAYFMEHLVSSMNW